MWKTVEDACKSTIRSTEKLQPRKKVSALYDPFYASYRKLYFDLKDRFKEMAALNG